jgi:hypothetical protein
MNSEDWHLIANVPAPEDGTRVVFFSPTKGQWIGNEPLGHGRGDWVWDGVNWLGKSHSLKPTGPICAVHHENENPDEW